MCATRGLQLFVPGYPMTCNSGIGRMLQRVVDLSIAVTCIAGAMTRYCGLVSVCKLLFILRINLSEFVGDSPGLGGPELDREPGNLTRTLARDLGRDS